MIGYVRTPFLLLLCCGGVIPIVEKHILLIYAVIGTVTLHWVSRRIFIVKNPLDPDVYRESVHMMQSKQGIGPAEKVV